MTEPDKNQEPNADITSPEFRRLDPAARVARLREAEDALWRKEHKRPRDPAIDKVAAQHRGENQ